MQRFTYNLIIFIIIGLTLKYVIIKDKMCNSKILLLSLCLFLFYYSQINTEHFDTNTAFMKQKGDYTAEQLANTQQTVIVKDTREVYKPLDNVPIVPVQPTHDNLNQLVMLNAEKMKQSNQISKASWDLLVAQPSNVIDILQSNINAESIPLPTSDQYPTLLSQLQLKVATLEYKYNKMLEEQNKYHKLTHNQYNTQISDINNTYNKQLENQKNELISMQQKINNANGNQFSKMLTELNSQVHNDMNKLREDLLASDRYKNFDNTGSWIK